MLDLVIAGAIFAIGALLAYGGRPLYGQVTLAVGFVGGAGLYYAYAAETAGEPSILVALLAGIVGAVAFGFVQFLALVGVGFLAGLMLAALLGVASEIVLVLFGLAGVAVALLVAGYVVVLATAGIGAFLIAHAVAAWPETGLEAVATAEPSATAFWLVFATGVLVQLGLLQRGRDPLRENSRPRAET